MSFIEPENWMGRKRLTIVAGHYGCGKTECAVNMALRLAECGKKVALADLDVINPFFRSRDTVRLLKEKGVRLVANSRMCANADIPSMPAEMNMILQDTSCFGIIDIGGDGAGAKVLARYREKIQREDYQMFFVINANRPLVSTTSSALKYLKNIEQASGLPVSGIVNNTHLCEETTCEDILRGIVLANEVSNLTGIPVVCHMIERGIGDIGNVPGRKFFVDIHMKKPWEK